MIIADFRAAFPEFTTALFPDPVVIFWSGVAEGQISEDRWGAMYSNGVFLLTAHYLTLNKIGASGVISGNSGVVTQKKVGDVSISYDTNFGSVVGGGLYNRTTYGQEYYMLMMIYGVGVIQL